MKKNAIALVKKLERTSSKQFIDTKLPVPYFTSDQGNCGIACVRMIIAFRKHNVPDEAELVQRYKHLPYYYLKHRGWTQKGLLQILDDYRVKAVCKDYATPASVIDNVASGIPVIVSISAPQRNCLHADDPYISTDRNCVQTGHLIVVVGINQSRVVVHDPRNLGIYRDDLPISYQVFKKIFMGRYLCPVKKS